MNIIKQFKKTYVDVFSYGKFFLENPKATKAERQIAVKKFFERKMPFTSLWNNNDDNDDNVKNDVEQLVEEKPSDKIKKILARKRH